MSLSPEEAQHSAAVESLIREELRQQRRLWLSFERFMELALYAPGLGYYRAGGVKIGAGGDFVTAPEVSDLFGFCLARQCAEVLAGMGGQILELGAGTGRMAACMLTELAALGSLPQRYGILEVSGDLIERQRARLRQLPENLRNRVEWLDRLPEAFRGVILANEVLDALPTRRIVLREGELAELGVSLAGDLLIEAPDGPDEELSRAWGELISGLPHALPPGYETEVCLRVDPWIASLGERLEQGVMLLIDYGLPRSQLYHPQRVHGTLRCHFKQQAHEDPYINIGVQDITAWVDFTRVAEAALRVGLHVAGFATQAAFLLATGIEQRVAQASDALSHARLAGEARRLLLPGEMGEAFKFMALTRGHDAALGGFALQDLRPSL
jgi:SAM-dependent MidA family methyltransferase